MNNPIESELNRWISVETPPTEDGEYFVYGGIDDYELGENKVTHALYKKGKWLWPIMEMPYEGNTHWMPLPTPPKELNKD